MQSINLAVWLDPSASIPPGALSLLIDHLSDRQPVLDIAADVMARYEKQNFSDQGAAFGDPWAPLAESTLREKARAGFPSRPLVRTGNLENEVGQMWVFGDEGVSVGINPGAAPYAAFLQNGTRRMPPRLLISVSQDEAEEVQREIQAFYDMIPGLPPGAVKVLLL